MTALTAGRDTKRRTGDRLSLPMSASKIFEGSIVCLGADGYATKGAVATTLRAAGRAASSVDNSAGNAGDLNIDVDRGIFKFENSAAADEITLADYGKDVYIVDDQTVGLTSDTGARSIAGKVRGVDADGVWVEL